MDKVSLRCKTLDLHLHLNKVGINTMKYLRQLYQWVLQWADHRHNIKALGFLALIEAIFFPIPPDALLLAMGTSQPKRALNYAGITTLFSVLGGLIGYGIGYGFWYLFQDFFFHFVFSESLFHAVQIKFQQNAFLSVFIASFTPIPFKVFTLAGGVAEISLAHFVSAAIFGRGLRFFIVGSLLYAYGEPIKMYIDRYFERLVVLFTVMLVGGFYCFRYIF